MAYTVKITNSSNRIIETKYRMPSNNMILSVAIQPRALLNEVNFPDEAHFTEWYKQNEIFFKRGILFENEKKEAKLKDSIENDSKNLASQMQNKIEKKTEDIQVAADKVNASISIETENLAEKRKIRR